ncbi:ATP-dependent DNA helicase [Nitrococcus mobilis]|uniref:ATP-dependent DNA helicase n=1 Tax=Nitrococcus mobilis TaxID=35797 RepID=UPI00031C3256|nr:ATP-dependent DNA helicase [Nitrococcus mobilis]
MLGRPGLLIPVQSHDLVEVCRHALGGSGCLARAVPGFQLRIQQLQMAQAVAEALTDSATVVIEAGTGIGKTFAYLVPALCSGRKVVLSTGTKTLQDQLFYRDLPLVAKALERPLHAALLKGRANYLCRYRLAAAAEEGRFDNAKQAAAFGELYDWSRITSSGDLTEAPLALNDPGLLGRATATADNCLGQQCPAYATCFLMEARRRAQEADVVVVNHHLLMADWAVRRGGFGEVLPAADAYVLDEAHQLAETAARFFGRSVSSRQLKDLARDTRLQQLREAPDSPALTGAAEDLQQAMRVLRLALGQGARRGAWAEVSSRPGVLQALQIQLAALQSLHTVLGPLVQRGKGLESCWRRAAEIAGTLQRFLAPEEEAGYVPWWETGAASFTLHLTPLDITATFHDRMAEHPAAWIFTSATLAVGGRFDHYVAQLGLGQPRTLQVESPFDYARNALLYVPTGLPLPNAHDYQARYLETVLQVLRASGGRAFLLFTSHQALDNAVRFLAERLPYPLLVQGQLSQNQLLQRFRDLGDAVLLGAQSFWEGVDVRGDALSCVMIDRLPFAAPSEPVQQARVDALRRRNANPFVDLQLPQAVIALRQGVGRLIRDSLDRGVLVIGDNRLVSRSYGRVFLRSLPPIPLTRRIGDVQAFFGEYSSVTVKEPS